MARKVKILVACGSGVATSSIAKNEVMKICEKAGYDVEVNTTDVSSMLSQKDYYDIVCVTNPYSGTIDKPLIPVFGLISRIGKDKIERQILDAVAAAAKE